SSISFKIFRALFGDNSAQRGRHVIIVAHAAPSSPFELSPRCSRQSLSRSDHGGAVQCAKALVIHSAASITERSEKPGRLSVAAAVGLCIEDRISRVNCGSRVFTAAPANRIDSRYQ